MFNIIQFHLNELFANKRETNNCIKEIFPVVVLADCLKYNKIKFTGNKGKAVDAILKNNDADILNVECTTSIEFRTMQIISEYNQKYKSCYITPRTKTVNIDKGEKQNYSDIIFCGTSQKRVLMPQNIPNSEEQYKISFKECIVNNGLIKQYAEGDIEQINLKIQKGIEKHCYDNFILVLSVKHDLPYELLNNYSKIIYDYWASIHNNPFIGIFVVVYDYILGAKHYKGKYYNPYLIPVPVFCVLQV